MMAFIRVRQVHWVFRSLVVALLTGAGAWLVLLLIPPPLLGNQANGSVAVLDREGRLLRLTLTGDEHYRLWTPLARFPVSLVEATLHYEDRHFRQHPGVNPAALRRAVLAATLPGQRRMGGSTLTMQLARQRWRLKTDTLTGKLRQMAYAVWLERHFSKAELLEAYLNLAPYGANIQGAGAAAWIYFQKPVGALSGDEARALALIPQNPTRRAPLDPAGREQLRAAWRTAYGADSGFSTLWFRSRENLPHTAPHFAERLRELAGGGRELHSTLDTGLQRLTQSLLTGELRRRGADGLANATAMVVQLPDLAVRAYVGSADYANRAIHGYVNGLKARRSPGSTLKPFIYALALEHGLITPDSLLKDTPWRVSDYQPENFEQDFYGPLSATEALVRSRNIPAISLLARLPAPSLYAWLGQADAALRRGESGYGLTLAMGGADVSMEELLRLYAVLGNAGEYRPLRWLADDHPAPPRRLLSAEAAWLTRHMLEANPRPQRSFGGRNFSSEMHPVAWKTGTSAGFRDAWAIGLQGDYLAGVWLGHFDGTPNRHFIGRDAAGPLLFAVLDALQQERPARSMDMPPPPGLKTIEICPVSGLPRSPWCPHGKTGWIIAGVSPTQPCAVHRPIRVNPAGQRLCQGDAGPAETRVAEFWDHDVLEQFQQAGIRRAVPPPFAKPCEDLAGSDTGSHPPVILAPQARLRYPLPSGHAPIEFSASADSARRLFWFVDDAFVGEGARLTWPGKPGQFEVRVVDDQGQSARVPLITQLAE